MYKLIAIDLDGTLLNPNGVVTDKTIAIIIEGNIAIADIIDIVITIIFNKDELTAWNSFPLIAIPMNL